MCDGGAGVTGLRATTTAAAVGRHPHPPRLASASHRHPSGMRRWFGGQTNALRNSEPIATIIRQIIGVCCHQQGRRRQQQRAMCRRCDAARRWAVSLADSIS